MKTEIERRYLKNTELRLEGDEAPIISGYAAMFDVWTDIGGMFKEKIAKGAFKKTIKDGDIRGLWNHDPNFVLGRNKSGTLELKEDSKGLRYDIKPPETQWARDVTASIKRGDVDQSSFGFRVIQSEDDYDKDTRILKEVMLFDVSPVTYPAYATTTAEVRSAFAKTKNADDREAEENAEKLESLLTKLRSGDELSEDDKSLLRYLSEVSEPGDHSDTIKPVNIHLKGTTAELLSRYKTLTFKGDK